MSLDFDFLKKEKKQNMEESLDVVVSRNQGFGAGVIYHLHSEELGCFKLGLQLTIPMYRT